MNIRTVVLRFILFFIASESEGGGAHSAHPHTSIRTYVPWQHDNNNERTQHTHTQQYQNPKQQPQSTPKSSSLHHTIHPYHPSYIIMESSSSSSKELIVTCQDDDSGTSFVQGSVEITPSQTLFAEVRVSLEDEYIFENEDNNMLLPSQEWAFWISGIWMTTKQESRKLGSLALCCCCCWRRRGYYWYWYWLILIQISSKRRRRIAGTQIVQTALVVVSNSRGWCEPQTLQNRRRVCDSLQWNNHRQEA